MTASAWLTKGLAAAAIVAFSVAASAQESMPSQMTGTWKIVRMLPTKTSGCWDGAKSLVGTTLTYRANAMLWQGGSVPLTGVITRTLTTETFTRENETAYGAPLTLSELNILTPRVTEVDLQHEDADVTGSTTEVPGDAVLLVGRNTIVISACGTFFEATRASSTARLLR